VTSGEEEVEAEEVAGVVGEEMAGIDDDGGEDGLV
jgi:hypothetical protein